MKFNQIPILHNPLKTREDVMEAVSQLCTPLVGYYSNNKALLDIGKTSAISRNQVIQMEGFSRPLWGLAPFWKGGGESKILEGIYIEGIKNGTNPENQEYWGTITDVDQRMVEMAALSLGLILVPDKIWDPLTEKEKENLYQWLNQINKKQPVDNNWLYFRVMVNLAFDTLGLDYDKSLQEKTLNRLEEFYLGDGWFSDGNTPQIDYYVPFGFYFYGLIYAEVMKNKDSERAERYKERAQVFAKEFIYWFSEDGSSIPFGRSLTYRFAQGAFWSALAFANIEVFSWGVMKGIILRHLRWWLSKPIYHSDGALSIGYTYPNLMLAEKYNAPGSPYWALKTFLLLALDENHPIWSAEEEPLPKLEDVKSLKYPNMMISRDGDHVVALTSGQYALFEPAHTAEKYAKFAYSTSFGFSVPKSQFDLSQGAFDSMLVFSEDHMYYRGRRKCEEVKMDGKSIYSRWKPWSNVQVETWLVPLKGWHVRIHKIQSERELITAEGGFAIAREKPVSLQNSHQELRDIDSIGTICPWGLSGIKNLMGERIPSLVLADPNTNVLHSSTSYIPTLSGKISRGTHLYASAVIGNNDFESGKVLWAQKPTLHFQEEDLVIVNQYNEEIYKLDGINLKTTV
ncbi:hypothetical protein JOC86_002086 [Bacillus pakistanensis]|uniref:DUF2264 domain-containing protein n=1 Tax=Rossellomorea pakistanensis TaxID=992288 RepID=A0ABS2NCR6_9BACI|nr:DUF2264 domain-containing protein [Bacillus pakistanensis]MBM7585544.1 hypothetical protein [Bacillus pakistanensis]